MIRVLKGFLTLFIFYLTRLFDDIYMILGNKIVGSQLQPSDANYLLYKAYQRVDTFFYIFIMVIITLVWLNEIKMLYKKIKEWLFSEGK